MNKRQLMTGGQRGSQAEGAPQKPHGGSPEASGWGGGMGGAREIFRAGELFYVTP